MPLIPGTQQYVVVVGWRKYLKLTAGSRGEARQQAEGQGYIVEQVRTVDPPITKVMRKGEG